MEQEGHTNMITQFATNVDGVDEEEEFDVIVNNDFIGKNKNMLAFFKEHDTEKRMAFSKLSEYFGMRAKFNKQMILEEKRDKAMNYMGRWDEYRVRRDHVVAILMKKKRQQNACRTWLVLQALHSRLQVFEQRSNELLELQETQKREEARQRKLEEMEALAAKEQQDEEAPS